MNLQRINYNVSDPTLPGAYIGEVAKQKTVSELIDSLIYQYKKDSSDMHIKKFCNEISDLLFTEPFIVTPEGFLAYLNKVKNISLTYSDVDNNAFLADLEKIVNDAKFINNSDFNDWYNYAISATHQFDKQPRSFPAKSYFEAIRPIIENSKSIEASGLMTLYNKLVATLNTKIAVGHGFNYPYQIAAGESGYNETHYFLQLTFDLVQKVANQTITNQQAEIAALAAAKAQAEADRALFEAQTLAEKAIADEAQRQADIAAAAATAAAKQADIAAAAKTAAEAAAAANAATGHANTAVTASGAIKLINKPIVDPRIVNRPKPTPTTPTTPETPTNNTTTPTTAAAPNYLLIGGAALAAFLILKK